MTLKPPQTFMRNLFGHDLGALNATKCPHNSPHMTHRAVKTFVSLSGWCRSLYDLFGEFMLSTWHEPLKSSHSPDDKLKFLLR